MSTPFNVMALARQAGIHLTGGFAVVAECVTLDELERFAQIAISQAISNTPPQSSMAWQEGYAAGKSYEWVGLTRDEKFEIINRLLGEDWVYTLDAAEDLLRKKNT